MTKTEALVEILRQEASESVSLTKYKRLHKLLPVLGIEDERKIFSWLGYLRYDTGLPYDWLAKKLQIEAERKAAKVKPIKRGAK